MTRKRKIEPFGHGWSRQQLLCYDLGCYVLAILGYVELIVEPDRVLSESESEKVSKQALKFAKLAAQTAKELYEAICSEERKAKERTKNQE